MCLLFRIGILKQRKPWLLCRQHLVFVTRHSHTSYGVPRVEIHAVHPAL